MKKTESINPHTGEIIASYARQTLKETESLIDQCQEVYLDWSKTSIGDRATYMRNLAKLFKERVGEYATMITKEMGKVIGQAEAEIEKCAWVCEHYAEHSEQYLSPETILTEAKKSYVVFQPLGIILGVMPWNFPFYQVIRFLAPVLMAGNGVVLKHASNVQGCALTLQKAVEDAGFPKGLFVNLNVSSENVEAIIEHKSIRAVSLTGSENAGKAVAAIAGKQIKKTVLELGGSDPYIILE
ncbi:MAG: aldehyde dehydrogenase family protein, partial [Flavobacteriales bacterium]|nr:aldehyde dehydrogenase family protein [Flavobacteriales bacterium]